MMKTRNTNTCAQFTLEYTIFLVVVIFAIFAMTRYISRKVQSGIKSNADSIGGGRQVD